MAASSPRTETRSSVITRESPGLRAVRLMPNIDITVSPDLEEMFDLPACSDISLPPPKPITLHLPGGATMTSFSDLSKGVPTDCAMTFSLLLQIAPFLAATECVVKVLKFVQTIVNVLKCFLSQLTSVMKILNETVLQISIAQANGNDELVQSLTCAQNNAMTQAQHLTSSLEALSVILDLAGDLMQIAGVQPIKLPSIGTQTDVNGLNQVAQTIQELVATLQIAADLLGGCQ